MIMILNRYDRQSSVADSSKRRSGFTVLELLVVTSVIGSLIALIMPALMVAREAARRVTCASHLRELGTALHQYHDRSGQLPLAWRPTRQDVRFAYGWATQILPELEQSDLSRQLQTKVRPTSTANSTIPPMPLLICPSDIIEPVFELWEEVENRAEESEEAPIDEPSRPIMTLPTANYQGVFGTVEADEAEEARANGSLSFGDGPLVHDRKVRWTDLERGVSNTLLVGERTMAMVPSTWLGIDFRGEDAACRLVGSAMTRPNCAECDECEFSSRHPGGSAFAWADGRVTLINDEIDSLTYQQLAQRAAE